MAFLRYTLLRVLLFLVVAALLWIVGIRGVWLVLFAILGSGIISVFALSRSRDAASVVLANRMSKIKSRMAERTAAEDAWDDRQRAKSEGGGVTGNTVGKEPGMGDGRWTKPAPTPGQDPRKRDEA
ncbi:MAG TPA: DUF4229 domain-containing protein [Jiangellaceae bacterium]|jgi:hypothetical protein|nr:DUF4229 domain-containing protein [Jiangellaceae bacterium]